MNGSCLTRQLGWAAVAISFAVASVTALAGPPRLVRDINSTIIPVAASPSDFLDQGAWSFFVASDGVRGAEPWATDGTPAGTVRLGSVNPLPTGITGYQTTRVGALAYFFTNGTNSGSALWSSDGTAAGTRLVADVASSGVNAGPVGALDDKFIFTLFENGAGRELWRSDGTAAGTYRIQNVNGANNGAISPLIANGKIYFFADTGNQSFEPWVSDGTTAGTHRIAQIPGAAQESVSYPTFVRVGQYLLFDVTTTVSGKELWRIDLNTDAVSQVADIAPGTTSSIQSPQFGPFGSVALFVASDTGGPSAALWRSDGTPSGTFLVANVAPISGPPQYLGPTDAGRMIFAIADSGSGDAHMWSTDGSSAVALTSTHSMLLDVIGGMAYFVTNPGTTPELWRTDGTPAGTRKLTGLPAAPVDRIEVAGSTSRLFVRTNKNGAFNVYRYETSNDSATLLRSYSLPLGQASGPSVFAFARGRLHFDSNDAVTGRELWTSDGTVAGTLLVRNIAPETRTQSAAPAHFFEFNEALYFAADDGIVGRELWRSDGTSGGTRLVADVNPGTASSDPLTPFALGNRLYFFAKDGATADSYKLWSTDGTPSGTSLVTAATPREALFGAQPPCGTSVVTLGAQAFFSAYDSGSGTELWRTDGSAAGTRRVSDIEAGTSGSDPCWLAQYQDQLFFAANVFATSGIELWRQDAAGNPSSLVADIYPGMSSSSPMEMRVFGENLYFLAGDASGRQLWKSDGTGAGTQKVSSLGTSTVVSSLTTAGDKLLFLRAVGSPVVQLWTSDGTTAGTAQLGTFGALGSLYSNGVQSFFRGPGSDAVGQTAPWVTDGTVTGTRLLVDTATSFAGQISFWDFRGVTIFQTPEATGQAKLWRTDGTSEGTREIGNVGVASADMYPVTHRVAGQTFFYAADDGSTGVELFAIDNDLPLAADDSAGSLQAGQSITVRVLSNDSDADGKIDAGSVSIAGSPSGGTVSVNSAGIITYTANASFSGADQFTYSVADDQGARSQPGTVQVTVTAAPTSPPTSPPTTTPPASSAGSGGGGGSVGALELICLLMTLVYANRRNRPQRRR